MSVNQYTIDPTSHPADAAMARENSPQPSGSTLTPEELAGYSTMSPADLVTQLANQNVEVPRDSPLHKMSGDQLKAEMQRSMKAIQDFRSVAQSVNRLESRAANSNDVTGLVGFPAFDSQGNVILDQTGSEYEKASRAADESRRSAARMGIGDREYDEAIAQLQGMAPNARPLATASGAPYEITKGTDGSYDVLIDTGEHFKGANADEIIQKLTHSKRKTGLWGRDLSRQLKQQQAGQPTNVPSPPEPTQATTSQPQFGPDADAFARTLGFSGIGELANEWQTMQQRDQKLAAMEQKMEAFETERLAMDFQGMCPDFPGTEAAADTVVKIIEASGLDYSPDNLALAHQHAIRKGFYQPLRPAEIEASYQPHSQQNSSRQAPPQPPPQNSPDSHDVIGNPWAMATDELRKKVLDGGGLGAALMAMTPGSTLGG